MAIYSLNSRYNVAPFTGGSFTVITGTTVRVAGISLPMDLNAGPLAVFGILVKTVNSTFIESITVNGMEVDSFGSGTLGFEDVLTALIAVQISSSVYVIDITFNSGHGGVVGGIVSGVAFGNVSSLFWAGKTLGSVFDNQDGGFAGSLFGPGGAYDQVLTFSAISNLGWLGSPSTVTTVAHNPNSGSIIYTDALNEGSFPDSSIQLYDSVMRMGYAIGNVVNYSTGTYWDTNNPGFAPTGPIPQWGAMTYEFAALPLADEATAYNCECEEDTGYSTLAELRRRLMIRLGYSAQVNNPPPGMTELLNDFLYSSQKWMYDRFKSLRTERFYSWTMEPGTRFYDLDANEETCLKRMNAYKVSWVGIEDLNGAWTPLIKGIPPECYTSINFEGLPVRYEIRQCIEVFPAPSAAYKLRIKAHFGLEPFDEDDDKTTIDSELVFLWALGVAKAHYGKPDADDIKAQANIMLGQLVAGTHETGRCIPNNVPQLPAPAPIFLPLT